MRKMFGALRDEIFRYLASLGNGDKFFAPFAPSDPERGS